MKKALLMSLLAVVATSSVHAGWIESARGSLEKELVPLVSDIGAALAGGLDSRDSAIGFPGISVSASVSAAAVSEDNSLISAKYIPVPRVEAALGLPKGINVFVRGLSIEPEDAGTSIGIIGGGASYQILKDKILSPVPGVSVVAAHNIFRTTGFTVGTTSIGLVSSKKLLFLKPRVGIFYDMTGAEIDGGDILGTLKPTSSALRYTGGLELTPFPFIFAGVSASMTGGNVGLDANAGLRIALPIF